MTPSFDRRSFVLGSLFGLGGLASAGGARRSPGPGPTLVLVQLTGGNDGLSTLVPYSQDDYARARRATRIGQDQVLRIDERVGLHPRLVNLRELYEKGHLALFEGVGYPEPNRSHFRSMDIWHAADARGRALGAGWIGRCVTRLENPLAHTVVHFCQRPPFALSSEHRAPLCLTPGLLRQDRPAQAEPSEGEHPLESAGEAGNETIVELRALLADTRASMGTLQAVLAQYRTKLRYPTSAFAQDLRRAAALIHADLGVRVCSLELDGFDTHRDQRGKHDRLMGELDQALDVFFRDLQRSESGREAIVLLFSEFGRRVEENASGGTDHGAASLALALGTPVHGGLPCKPPSLEALQDGDLAFTTDFRSIYASCIQHVFELDPAEILGGDHEPLPFV